MKFMENIGNDEEENSNINFINEVFGLLALLLKVSKQIQAYIRNRIYVCMYVCYMRLLLNFIYLCPVLLPS